LAAEQPAGEQRLHIAPAIGDQGDDDGLAVTR
jgi:hypothetical protein